MSACFAVRFIESKCDLDLQVVILLRLVQTGSMDLLRRTQCFVWPVSMDSWRKRPLALKTKPLMSRDTLCYTPMSSPVQVGGSLRHESLFKTKSVRYCKKNLLCLVIVAGRKLNIEDIILAEELFTEIMKESSNFITQGGEPFPSVGEFVRAQVLCCTLLHMQQNKMQFIDHGLCSGLVQVQQRAAEKWKDIDEPAKSLLLCTISTLLKLESGYNGAHSMDEVALGAYGQYKTLPGVDCTFPGFVLQLNAILFQ